MSMDTASIPKTISKSGDVVTYFDPATQRTYMVRVTHGDMGVLTGRVIGFGPMIGKEVCVVESECRLPEPVSESMMFRHQTGLVCFSGSI
jgi:hypothetical protein